MSIHRCSPFFYISVIIIIISIYVSHVTKENNVHVEEESNQNQNQNHRLVVLKLGGSSITNKDTFETLNQTMLDWVASTLASATSTVEDGINSCVDDESICSTQRNQFVIVHDAGSFGHITARKYGLKGHTDPPPPPSEITVTSSHHHRHQQQYIMEGLAQTRLSVTKLNWHVVQTLLKHSLPAVGVSPFAVGCRHTVIRFTYKLQIILGIL